RPVLRALRVPDHARTPAQPRRRELLPRLLRAPRRSDLPALLRGARGDVLRRAADPGVRGAKRVLAGRIARDDLVLALSLEPGDCAHRSVRPPPPRPHLVPPDPGA